MTTANVNVSLDVTQLRDLPAAERDSALAAISSTLEGKTAEEIATWAAGAFGTDLIVAASMQDVILPHLFSARIPGVQVMFLQTGYHFPETLLTRDVAARSLPITVIEAMPVQSVAEQDAEYGEKLHDRNPTQCCQLRKVDPINAELAGYEAWVTGIRREDNALRANARLVEWDPVHQMVKVNPIAPWSFDDLLGYASTHQVPVNLLLTDGYPSIGCAPCTRRVEPGEDPRAGRWAGLAKTECGLHL